MDKNRFMTSLFLVAILGLSEFPSNNREAAKGDITADNEAHEEYDEQGVDC